MRIAFIISGYPPKVIAGTELATQNLANCLAKKGNDVYVLTMYDASLPEYRIENGVHVHRIRSRGIAPVEIMVFCIRALLIIRKINPDIIHCQSLFRDGVTSYLAKMLFHKEYIVHCHGSDVYMDWSFKPFVSGHILGYAGGIVAQTEDMKKEIMKTIDNDFYILPNGIDAEKYSIIDKRVARKSLGLQEDSKIIIFVGRLIPLKGVNYLIEAISKIKEKKNILLLIVGNGEERRQLEELVWKSGINNIVRFSGRVPYDAVPKYLCASDIMVLPSLSEGFPNVVLEAMSSGMPVIVTNVRGLPEIIKEGENGFLVDPGNSVQIAKKLSLLLDDPELVKEISLKNLNYVKNCSWDNITTQLMDIYHQVLEK